MSGASQSSGGGIGFLGLLTLLFIALKLTETVSWSWWLVLLPLYGPLAVVLVGTILWVLYEAAKWPWRKP